MIYVEPVIIKQDRYGPVWDVRVLNDQGKVMRAYYGVTGHTVNGVIMAVGHCNKIKDGRRREALLQQELP